MTTALPPFVRGRVGNASLLPSVWIRGLEEVREMTDRWAGDLSTRGFWWTPGEKVNPIGCLVRHIAGASLRLMHNALGEPIPKELIERRKREFQPDNEDPASVLTQFHQELAIVQDRISALTDPELEAVRDVGRLGAKTEAAFIWHHLVEHAQHHVGQIIVMRKLWNVSAGEDTPPSNP